MMGFGVPASGPMDRLAHAAANAAVGMPQGATAIEVSMGGLEMACESGEVTFRVAGGELQVVHSGVVTTSWCVRTLRAGDLLSVRPGRWGSWAYVAFSGEPICDQWAGSTSTHAASGLGGGRLTSGTAIVVRNPSASEEREGDLPAPDFARQRPLARVVLGPQTEQFEPESTVVLLREEFAVTAAGDRMGMRLAGPKLSSDTDGVSQLRPHDRSSFHAVDADEAVRLARAHAESKRQFLAGLADPRGNLTDRLMRENLISGVV